MKNEEAYSVFEETEDPMENMILRKNRFIGYIFCFLLLGIIFIQCVETEPSKYNGKENYYEIQGIQIPTLYLFTEFSDVFSVQEVKDVKDKNLKGEYVVVFYNQEIPENIKNNYRENLHEFSYRKILYNENELYVLNNGDNTSFSYIIIGKLQVKYGVCVSGPYEDVLQ